MSLLCRNLFTYCVRRQLKFENKQANCLHLSCAFSKKHELAKVINSPLVVPKKFPGDSIQPATKQELDILRDDRGSLMEFPIESRFYISSDLLSDFPEYCDICVIGGGVMGLSIAYWLSLSNQVSVVVIERDLTYENSSSFRTMGGLRTHFMQPENVQLSMFCQQFLRNSELMLDVKAGDVSRDVQFRPSGTLLLTSDETRAQSLETAAALQTQCGARVQLFSPERVRTMYPWLRGDDDLKLAALGVDGEGSVSGPRLLRALLDKCVRQGVVLVEAEVCALDVRDGVDVPLTRSPSYDELACDNISGVYVRLSPEAGLRYIPCHVCVMAAGAGTHALERLARVGAPLPVRARRQHLYQVTREHPVTCSQHLSMPFVIDLDSGLQLRTQGYTGVGRVFVCSLSDPWPGQANVSAVELQRRLHQCLQRRFTLFDEPQLSISPPLCAVSDICEHDGNALIGVHPALFNTHVVAGFGNHGLQHAPGVGRALSELILHNGYRSIDLKRFGCERLYSNQRFEELSLV